MFTVLTDFDNDLTVIQYKDNGLLLSVLLNTTADSMIEFHISKYVSSKEDMLSDWIMCDYTNEIEKFNFDSAEDTTNYYFGNDQSYKRGIK